MKPFVIFIGAAITALGLGSAATYAQSCSSAMLHTDPTSPLFLSGDTPFGPTQDGMNCYAWQMFMALNWPVNPGWPGTASLAGEPDRSADISSFGVPATSGQPMTDATVWQSFMPAPGIFKPNAPPPNGWGTSAAAPAGCGATSPYRALQATGKSAIHPAHRFNLSTGTESTVSDEILEATGGWLVDQDGELVFFERLVGKAEYDYIVKHQLYDAANQATLVASAEGLALPKGASAMGLSTPQSQEELGAFELKAAWRNLTGKPSLWPRYLTSRAYLTGPDKSCTEAVVGLVGLHIIHKTASMPDFVWSTFEQIDNVPETGKAAPSQGYSFNDGKGTTPANQMPKCTGSSCDYTTPIQTTRLVPTPSGLQSVNADMQSFFAKQTKNASVFQYYKLVNVLWDGAPTRTNPGKGATVPLTYGTFQSEANAPVANTTMETYAQYGIQTAGGLQPSCAACHQNATIAGSKTLASDFSFLLGTAHSASQVKGVRLAKEFHQ